MIDGILAGIKLEIKIEFLKENTVPFPLSWAINVIHGLYHATREEYK